MSSGQGDGMERADDVASLQRLLALRERLSQSLLSFAERSLGITDEPTLSELILETAATITRSDRALLSGIADDVVTITAGFGKDRALVGLRVASGEPIVYDTLRIPEAMVVEDVDAVPASTLVGRIARTHQTRSFVLCAMRSKGQVVGHLFTGSGESRRYEKEEIEALRLLSSMAAGRLALARGEKELEARRVRLDALLEHLPIPVAVVNRQGTLVHSNAAWRGFASDVRAPGTDFQTSLSGVRMLQLDGQPIPPSDLLVSRAFAGEQPPPRESVLETTDGRRFHVLSVAAPLTNPGGEIPEAVMAFQDVSPLRALADAKDRFLRIASHELRSPLASLRATVELISLDRSRLTDPERRDTVIARIDRQTDRLTRLVEQLLDSARLNAAELPLHPEEIDLLTLCRHAIDQLTPEPGGHTIGLDGEGPTRGHWDPMRLEQVLTNLLTNAIRYSPSGSAIEVRVTGANDLVTVAVTDHGIGIPPDQLEHLFEPFYRAPNAQKMSKSGIGLGLHITSEIVRRHGGRLRVKSDLGLGSTFSVELPRRPHPIG